MKIKVQ